MSSIKPTVGRVVLYYPYGHPAGEEPLAAQIATVQPSGLLNLGALSRRGDAFPAENVRLLEPGVEPNRHADGRVSEDCAVWMPYQVTQAAKHDAEQVAAGVLSGGDRTTTGAIGQP